MPKRGARDESDDAHNEKKHQRSLVAVKIPPCWVARKEAKKKKTVNCKIHHPSPASTWSPFLPGVSFKQDETGKSIYAGIEREPSPKSQHLSSPLPPRLTYLPPCWWRWKLPRKNSRMPLGRAGTPGGATRRRTPRKTPKL